MRGAPQPLQLELFRGMRVHLTRNMAKKDDFVNGMEATVEHYDSSSRCVRVLTKTGHRLAVYPVSEDVDVNGQKHRVKTSRLRSTRRVWNSHTWKRRVVIAR